MKRNLLLSLILIFAFSAFSQTIVNYHAQRNYYPKLKVNQISADGIAYFLEPVPGNGSGKMFQLDIKTGLSKQVRDSLPKNVSYIYLDSNTVYMPESNSQGPNAYITRDGFKTIQKLSGKFLSVRKFEDVFYATGAGGLLRSTDFVSWISVAPVAGNLLFKEDAIYNLINLTNVYKSTDDGQIFTMSVPNSTFGMLDFTLNHVYSNDNKEFLVSDRNTYFYYSNDGCSSWSKRIAKDNTKNFLYASSLDSIYFTSSDNSLYLSIDTCKTIKKVPGVILPFSIRSKVLTKVGDKLFYEAGDVLMSSYTPAGSWKPHYGLPLSFGSILANKDDVFFTIDKSGAFAVSRDGGLVFDTVTVSMAGQTIFDVADAFVLNDSTFFVLEKNGKVFTTKNAGRTWISQSESDAQLKGLGEFRYKAETNTLSITFTNKTKYSTNYGASWKKYSHQPKNSVETLSEDLYIQVYPTVYHADYIAGDPVPTIPKIVFEKKAPQGAFGTEVKFNQIPNSDTMSLRTMRMFDQNLGYMLIADTKFNMQVYKTENAWVSFDKIATIPQASTYSMTVFSRDTLFFNSGMDFFYSFDGGIQWGKTTFEFLNTGLKILPSELVFLKNGGFIIPNSNGFYVGGELKGTNLNDPLGVNKDLFSQKEVEDLFYPNPSSGELFFTSDVHLEKIVIYNAAGYQVLETKYSSKIDVSALSKGVYILKMEGNNKIFTQKLIVE